MIISDFEELDTSEETKLKYLQDGPMTQQFLNDTALDSKMSAAKTDREKVKILYLYIHTHTKNATFASNDYKRNHKFQRTAAEIWSQKQMTGCTDYALVFATLARKYGLPTTILDTLEQGCLDSIQAGKPVNSINGHAFCECFMDGEWKLLDPTFAITEKTYNPEHIKLTGFHNVKFKKNFIPISRKIDTERTQSIREHNEILQEMILGKFKAKPEIKPITKAELDSAGYSQEKPSVTTPINKSKDNELTIGKDDLQLGGPQ